jgi:hypothetical protein
MHTYARIYITVTTSTCAKFRLRKTFQTGTIALMEKLVYFGLLSWLFNDAISIETM